MLRTFPAYSHPSTLLFVDDDGFLLDSIETSLKNRFNIKKFRDANEAVAFIKQYQTDPKYKPCMDLAIQYSRDFVIEEQRPTIVNLSGMMSHLLNPNRFDTIAVVVFDFAMPSMTGIEFLEKIRNFDCKKIMFTGEAWNIEGLNIFNLNLIDRVSKKGQPAGIMANLFEDMQLRYFQDHSMILLQALRSLSLTIPRCLEETELTSPIFDLLRSHGIVEHYLINHEGFFLTVNATGELGLFILQSESEKTNHGNKTETIKTSTETYHYAFAALPEEQKVSLKNIVGFGRGIS